MESPQLLQTAPPSGSLQDVSALRLYYLLAVSETTGQLVLGEGRDAISIWFKQGTPQAVHCEALGLGRYLVDQGVVTAAALAGAQPRIAQMGGDVASGLFSAGLLNPSTAFPLIQQHAQTVLQRGLLMEQGPFTFDLATSVPASGFQLGSRWKLLAGAARRIDSLSVEQRLRPHLGQAPLLAGSTTDLALTAQETRLLSLLDGSRSLETLVEQAGALEDGLRRLLVLLQEIDRLTWAPPVARATPAPAPDSIAPPPPSAPPNPSTSPPLPPKPPTSAPPKPPAPAPAAAVPSQAPAPKSPVTRPPTSPPIARPAQSAPTIVPLPSHLIATDVPSLRKLRDLLLGKDYFGRLNVGRSRAPVPNLKMSYLQLAKVYHPDTVPPEAPPEARKLKEDILSLLNEAYSALNDERQRVEYVDELEAREQVGDLDVEAILAAEEDFQHATLLAKARKYGEALALLETCIARNPKEGEFYAWRGYCRFFGASDKRSLRNAVLEDLLRALELSPKCTVAWLFQGQVFKLLNETALAKQAFQKTLELDSANVEAQRELRLYETRKQ